MLLKKTESEKRISLKRRTYIVRKTLRTSLKILIGALRKSGLRDKYLDIKNNLACGIKINTIVLYIYLNINR